MNDKNIPLCCVTGEPLSEERIEVLQMLNIPQHLWAKVDCSPIKRVREAASRGAFQAQEVEPVVEKEEVETEV